MGQEELSNYEIVVYALFKLEGFERNVHTEEVAFEAYQLAKARFGWRLPRFRKMNFPDKDIVRVALTDAAKPKYGRLVRGRAGADATGKAMDGWMLTAAGVAWVQANQARLGELLGRVPPQIHPDEARRFRKRMQDEPLFVKFRRGESFAQDEWYDFTGMLNASPDAPRDIIVRKFERLCSTAQMAADPELVRFLEACGKAFIQAMADTSERGSRGEEEP